MTQTEELETEVLEKPLRLPQKKINPETENSVRRLAQIKWDRINCLGRIERLKAMDDLREYVEAHRQIFPKGLLGFVKDVKSEKQPAKIIKFPTRRTEIPTGPEKKAA